MRHHRSILVEALEQMNKSTKTTIITDLRSSTTSMIINLQKACSTSFSVLFADNKGDLD